MKNLKELGLHPGLQNTVWLICEHLFRLALALFVTGAIARYLQPASYGLLNYALAIYGIFTVIEKLGFDAIVLKELSSGDDKHVHNVMATSLGVRFLSAMGILFVGALTFILADPGDPSYWLLAIVGIGLLLHPLDIVEIQYQAKSKSREVVRLKLVQLFISSVFRLGLVYFGASLSWFAFAVLFDQILLTFIYVYLFRAEKIPISLKVSPVMAKKLVIASLPILTSSVFALLYMRIDQIMIKAMMDDTAVGIYSVASRLAELWYFIPMAAVSSFSPAILRALQNGSEAEFEKRAMLLIRGLFVMSVFFGIGVEIFADLIVKIVFGSSYADAADVLRLLVWSGVFVAIGSAQMPWLTGKNLQGSFFARAILGATINFALNFPFIRIWGVTGACFASLLTHLWVSVLFDLFYAKTRPLFWLKMRAIFFLPYERRP